MPALLLVLVLLLAGCVPGRAAPDGVPTADVPFTLAAWPSVRQHHDDSVDLP